MVVLTWEAAGCVCEAASGKMRWGSLFLIIAMAGGCTTTVVPPAHPIHPATVFVTDYGRHSSILLPDPHGGFIEYAFGDYEWFALGHTNPLVAIRAMISSPESTLTRRWIFNSTEVADTAVANAQQLTVDGDRVTALRNRLDYEYDIHTDAGMVYSAFARTYAVPCDEQYNLFHNCNHVTGEWLRELGARTNGTCMFSRFQVIAADGR